MFVVKYMPVKYQVNLFVGVQWDTDTAVSEIKQFFITENRMTEYEWKSFSRY